MSEKPSENSKKKTGPNPLMRFAGVGIQMGVIITGGALLGNYLDEKQQNEKPIWTIVLSLLAIGIAMYLVIRAALNLTKDEE